MISRNAKYILMASTILISGCSQNQAPQSASHGTETKTTTSYDASSGTKTTTTVEKTGTGAPNTNVDVEKTGHSDVSVNVQSDNPNDNVTAQAHNGKVHVSAPGFHLDKDKSTGSVQIDTPFFHLNKTPGAKTKVNIDIER